MKTNSRNHFKIQSTRCNFEALSTTHSIFQSFPSISSLIRFFRASETLRGGCITNCILIKLNLILLTKLPDSLEKNNIFYEEVVNTS